MVQGGVKPGLAFPEKLIKVLIDANPDAILLSGGMARTYNHLFGGKNKPSLIISSDFILSSSIPQMPGDGECIYQSISVEECVRLGADAIKALLIFGRKDIDIVARNMKYITELAEQCSKWNLPLIVEPTTWGSDFTSEIRNKASVYADMARICGELGADMVKCDYVGPSEAYQQVIDNCPVPIAILGGSKASPEQIADTIEGAMKCNAAGVVFGRNVWQSEDPAKMVEALKAITHHGDRESLLKAMQII